jgi:hypothetical protein
MEHASRRKRLQVIYATQYMQPCAMYAHAKTNLMEHKRAQTCTQTRTHTNMYTRFCISACWACPRPTSHLLVLNKVKAAHCMSTIPCYFFYDAWKASHVHTAKNLKDMLLDRQLKGGVFSYTMLEISPMTQEYFKNDACMHFCARFCMHGGGNHA